MAFNDIISISLIIVIFSITQQKQNGWPTLLSSTSPLPTQLSSSVSFFIILSTSCFLKFTIIIIIWFKVVIIIVMTIIKMSLAGKWLATKTTTNAIISTMHLRDWPNLTLSSHADIFLIIIIIMSSKDNQGMDQFNIGWIHYPVEFIVHIRNMSHSPFFFKWRCDYSLLAFL